jgi:hypothetical protein
MASVKQETKESILRMGDFVVHKNLVGSGGKSVGTP